MTCAPEGLCTLTHSPHSDSQQAECLETCAALQHWVVGHKPPHRLFSSTQSLTHPVSYSMLPQLSHPCMPQQLSCILMPQLMACSATSVKATFSIGLTTCVSPAEYSHFRTTFGVTRHDACTLSAVHSCAPVICCCQWTAQKQAKSKATMFVPQGGLQMPVCRMNYIYITSN